MVGLVAEPRMPAVLMSAMLAGLCSRVSRGVQNAQNKAM
ncbi:MAG: hypothetical protein QOH65_1894, partial [Methylobacteriaceae bacterium]|nr:hypothetical protein [Methylobacteriaceae bacterium]